MLTSEVLRRLPGALDRMVLLDLPALRGLIADPVIMGIRPALNTETFFETIYGLSRYGKVDENGVPPLLQTAIICRTYENYLPSPPIWLQKALFAVLAPVGRLMGYRASYPEYSGADPLVEVDGSGGGGRQLGMIVATVGAGVLAVALLRRWTSLR